MKKELNYRFISALNKQAEVYEQADPSAKESIVVTEKDCVRRIELSATWQQALISFLECVPTINDQTKTSADVPRDIFRFMSALHSLQRVITGSAFSWIADAITLITAGQRVVDNSGPWSMLINVLCSDAFKSFSREVDEILGRFRFLSNFWSSNMESFVNHFGVILANALSEALSALGIAPSANIDFEEQLIRFMKIRLKRLDDAQLADLCLTWADINTLLNTIGATPEQREKACQDLWDKVSTYVLGIAGVVIDSIGGARNAISSFVSSVGAFMRENEETIKITVLISLAIAAAVAAAASGGTAAPALAVAVLALAGALGIQTEGWTRESIERAIQNGSV
jgi:hypothetical protein